MEFWGLEVKPGETVKCEAENDYFVHLSQAALGESKKGSDNALMFVQVDDKKLAIGTLSAEKFPHIQFDLVFDNEFELSHTSKTASVFFSGYKVHQPAEGDDMDFDSEEIEDEEQKNIPVITENGKGKEQKSQLKIDAVPSKPKAVAKDVVKSTKDDVSASDGSDDSDDDDDSQEDVSLDEDSTEDSEDGSDDDEEETPKKPETGKKRAAESVLKTPASDKKAKVATPAQNTGGKKGVHVATPHPAKQASKTPGNNEKSPKSGGSIACKSCNKTFSSEMGMQAHSKAKHGGK